MSWNDFNLYWVYLYRNDRKPLGIAKKKKHTLSMFNNLPFMLEMQIYFTFISDKF